MSSPTCPHCLANLPGTPGACPACGQHVTSTDIVAVDSPKPEPLPSDAIQTTPTMIAREAAIDAEDADPARDVWERFRANSNALQEELLELLEKRMPDLGDARTLPLPGEIPGDPAELGMPLATIQTPGELRGMSKVVGFSLSIVGTLILVVNMAREFLAVLWGVCLLSFGAWFLFKRRPRLPATYWLCENGIAWQRGGSVGYCLWDQIEDFRASFSTGRPLYWITINDELQAVLSAGHATNAVAIARHIEIKASSANLLPKLRRIIEGEKVVLGRVTMNRDGVSALWSGRIGWWELESVSATGFEILFHLKSGTTVAVRHRDVGFPIVTMAIARIMIAEHASLQ